MRYEGDNHWYYTCKNRGEYAADYDPKYYGPELRLCTEADLNVELDNMEQDDVVVNSDDTDDNDDSMSTLGKKLNFYL